MSLGLNVVSEATRALTMGMTQVGHAGKQQWAFHEPGSWVTDCVMC